MTKKEAEAEEKRKTAIFAKAGQQALGIKTETIGHAKPLGIAKSVSESEGGKALSGHTPISKVVPLNERHVSGRCSSQLQDANLDRDGKFSTMMKRQNPSESGAKRSQGGSSIAEKLDAFI